MQDFKIGIRPFEKVLKQALAQAYSFNPEFANESDFKYELFHQLHALEINGHRLGDKLPGYNTSMLHSEAKPKDGLNRRADILICNPTAQRIFNYQTEVVVELKESLGADKLIKELDKFSEYNNGIRKLYIASANRPKIDDKDVSRIVKNIRERQSIDATVLVLDRARILGKRGACTVSKSRRGSRAKSPLSERVAKCVATTLNLYGKNRKDIRHSFFWRNYEYHEGNWTFPSEGDFVCQLYHRLRARLKNTAIIRTEYHPPSASNRKVDLFVDGIDATVGIEVKMNYDNICKYKRDDTPALSQRFVAMSNDNLNHSNFLVVIQGEHAYAKDNKAIALEKLRKISSDFSLLYYDEIRNKTIGPVSVEEAQKLAIR